MSKAMVERVVKFLVKIRLILFPVGTRREHIYKKLVFLPAAFLRIILNCSKSGLQLGGRKRKHISPVIELYDKHNGAGYLVPDDLVVSNLLPRRVLLVGSCLADVWKSKFNCPYDFVLTNNLSELPDSPPQAAENYDLQIIQVPLRFVIPDNLFWSASFLDIEAYEKAFSVALDRMKFYLSLAGKWNKDYKILTFVSNFLVPQQNAMGRLAPRYDIRNPAYFIEQLNIYLAREVSTWSNAYVLDVDGIAAVFGKKYIQDDSVEIQTHASVLGNSNYEKDKERIEFIEPMDAHYELHIEKFVEAIWQQALAAFRTVRQADMIKLIIFDLDNTLWRGVVAEENEITDQVIEGWPLGLFEALSFLKKRGIILAIASKNDESRIKGFWENILCGKFSLDDFAIIKINWNRKVDNIQEIMQLVNVLPRNVLFVDDNPVERAAVKAAFPDIRVLGTHPYYLKRILLWSAETQVVSVSRESSNRTEMIQSQVNRESLRSGMTREDFLTSLDVKVRGYVINSVEDSHFARSFELINKTNQYNTTGKRWTQEECRKLFSEGGCFYSFSVQDRFTDYGLVGCVLIHDGIIIQFVMSCRVIGLDVEIRIITDVIEMVRRSGHSRIDAMFVETSANLPCRDLYEKNGFERSVGGWGKSIR